MELFKIVKAHNLYREYERLENAIEKFDRAIDEGVFINIFFGCDEHLAKNLASNNISKYSKILLNAMKDDLMTIEKQLEEM